MRLTFHGGQDLNYEDFVLHIHSRVVHVQSEQGQGQAPFVLPFDSADRWLAASAHWNFMGRPDEGWRRPSPYGEAVGEKLFEALFSGEVLQLWERCIGRLEGQRDLGLRIKLV